MMIANVEPRLEIMTGMMAVVMRVMIMFDVLWWCSPLNQTRMMMLMSTVTPMSTNMMLSVIVLILAMFGLTMVTMMTEAVGKGDCSVRWWWQ